MALRARIVLACAEGAQNQAVAAKLDVCEQTVSTWRRRFAATRMEGRRDEARPGAPRTVDDARIEAVITATLESGPSDATHWSSRDLARTSGLSVSTVQRRVPIALARWGPFWRAFGLQPYRLETSNPRIESRGSTITQRFPGGSTRKARVIPDALTVDSDVILL